MIPPPAGLRRPTQDHMSQAKQSLSLGCPWWGDSDRPSANPQVVG